MTYIDENKIHSHLDRLQYDEHREAHSLFGNYWMSGVASTAALGAILSSNYSRNKPLYTGLWRAAILAPIAAYGGLLFRDRVRERSRVKWAKIQHYIELHPEDFPPYPRRIKIGETLSPWIPRRGGW